MTGAVRQKVVVEARSWVGTPYHHCADIKGVGVDCGMILVRVFCDLGVIPPVDPRPYAHDWMLHREEEIFKDLLIANGRHVEAPGLGDVILFRFGRCYSHGSIVTRLAPLTIVHAYLPYGAVVEESVASNGDLSGRLPDAIIASIVQGRA